jgi:hypothetical protein
MQKTNPVAIQLPIQQRVQSRKNKNKNKKPKEMVVGSTNTVDNT